MGSSTVTVVLAQFDRVVLERGRGAPSGSGSEWVYHTQTAVSLGQRVLIHVTASDRPEDHVTTSFEHEVL